MQMATCSIPDESAPCARPGRREARREERREAILDVAEASFLEHGYAGTSMSAIASTLGGSKGTLWSYFPSKDLLFGAVLDRVTNKFREQTRLVLTAAEPVSETLLRFCTTFIAKLTSPEAVALHRLVMGESGRFPEVGRIFYERAPMRTQERIGEFLDAAMAAGRLRRADPLHAAQALFALCTARFQMPRLTGVCADPGETDPRAEAEAAVDLFMRAYAPE